MSPLGIYKLGDINLIVEFSEIGQEFNKKLLIECKTKWHATLNRGNNNKLRTYQLTKRFSIRAIPKDANYQEREESVGF